MAKMTKLTTAASAAAILVAVAGCGTANNTSGGNTSSGNGAQSSGGSQKVTLAETGSSLLYPLFNGQWIDAYKSVDSNVTLTAGSTGSGNGISQSLAGTVQIGASDAYLSKAVMQQHSGMLNIPMAISAQQIMYNIPGLNKKHLHLSGNVIGQVYEGKIKYWDNSAIKALNPGVSLPHKQIVPVRRSDGSGDTFLFTQFLSKTNTAWGNQVHYGTTVSWPKVSAEVGAKGNEGVVTDLANDKYSIGYVGISWLDKATQKGVGYAALKNKSGNFVLPNSTNIKAAAANLPSVPADERVSLIEMPGKNSYPIINFEYAIVKSQQKDAATAKALKKFLDWAISPTGGNQAKYLNPVHFRPLPSNIEPKSKAQIAKIKG
ncbi:phosphate ABC transporter substrate-binding protein PstS [Alicyclobacillus sp. SO9]|uniref:phosphate ABC transporter substrate-binding protein PstS n=1 Tax=Alicyclobacillus sp. SO9 TaxID=2665646 RepID=UPI0018E8F5A9|nr:phosphate ABC transporter substrate-binding protein PstS [Alicyclobacillus sp. SO9]QQE77888.1 phosphate ABC transporter substrate-binding protein PstS [Alicyclobacillus sp. SO9]QQE78164.1 phosphate ABC transporter substrate-binding protein PstS [Alicyclobacillus sp. SO9]